jgi:hypothetical protein
MLSIFRKYTNFGNFCFSEKISHWHFKFFKKKKIETAETEKNRKNENKRKKRHWAGPTGTLGGAVPGPHRPGWCIAPPLIWSACTAHPSH